MVYRPREDSHLLKQAVTSLDLKNKKFLDMGTGTGYVAEAALKQGADVTAVDIDPEAVDKARSRLPSDVDVLQSDLFTHVESNFDAIAFNPPYLPESQGGSTATVSGCDGAKTSRRFLGECAERLKDGGAAMVVVSSRNGLETEGFEVLCTMDLWFERLKVVRVQNSF